jgi:aryl-alcohol dehydrogenase-like predicted oxidoreductase
VIDSVIEQRQLGRSGLRGSALGMGCARLGSLRAAGGPRAAERALEAALDAGIRFFDTADSYAQGDSERLLGRVLGRIDGVTIATKAGYRLPAPEWALRLAKPPLRLAAWLSGALDRSVDARRRRGFRQCFEPAHLRHALHGSLRRLGRARVELFMLHSPPPELAASEALWRFVDDAKFAGDMRCFGVSCGGGDLDIAWLRQPAVEVVQLPFGPIRTVSDAFLATAVSRGIGIVAREILGGPGRHDAAAIEAALRAVLAEPAVAVALVGMARAEHVRATAALACRVTETPVLARRA